MSVALLSLFEIN